MDRRLRIASPCHASWDQMEGDDRIRHCAECNLHVYNFAAMTTAEVQELVATHQGRLCGRLYQRADGTVLTKDCPVGFRVKVRRVSRIAGTALAAATAGVGFAAGQTLPAPAAPGHVKAQKNDETGITIEVTDPIGARIPNARVSLVDTKGNSQLGGATGADGIFRVLSLKAGIYKAKIESPGFMTAVVESIDVASSKVVALEVTLEVGAQVLLGEVINVHADIEPERSKLPAKIEPRLPLYPNAAAPPGSKK